MDYDRRLPVAVTPVGRTRISVALARAAEGVCNGQEWADPQWRERILFVARSVETQPSLIGVSGHLSAAAIKP